MNKAEKLKILSECRNHINNNRNEELEKILDENPEFTKEFGSWVLGIATNLGKLEAMQIVIAREVDPNSTDTSHNTTALTKAINNIYTATDSAGTPARMIECLLNNGADPLIRSGRNEQTDFEKALIHKVDPEIIELMILSCLDRKEEVLSVIKNDLKTSKFQNETKKIIHQYFPELTEYLPIQKISYSINTKTSYPKNSAISFPIASSSSMMESEDTNSHPTSSNTQPQHSLRSMNQKIETQIIKSCRDAIRNNRNEELEKILDENPEFAEEFGPWVLGIAINLDKLEAMQIMIARRVDINSPYTSNNTTALTKAINNFCISPRKEVTKMVKYLLVNGADPLIRSGRNKKTDFEKALIRKVDPEIIELMILSCLDRKEEILSVIKNDLKTSNFQNETKKIIHQYFPELTEYLPIQKTSYPKNSAISFPIASSSSMMESEDTNSYPTSSNTQPQHSLRSMNQKIETQIIKSCRDAIRNNRNEELEKILDENPEFAEARGPWVLGIATNLDKLEAMKIMIARRVDINSIDTPHNTTALTKALNQFHKQKTLTREKVIKYLLKRGADPLIKSGPENQTDLEKALTHRIKLELAELIISKCAYRAKEVCDVMHKLDISKLRSHTKDILYNYFPELKEHLSNAQVNSENASSSSEVSEESLAASSLLQMYSQKNSVHQESLPSFGTFMKTLNRRFDLEHSSKKRLCSDTDAYDETENSEPAQKRQEIDFTPNSQPSSEELNCLGEAEPH